MQYFTVTPTLGEPPIATQAAQIAALVRGNDDAEWYVAHMLALLINGSSPTAARSGSGWVLAYTGGVGDDEDGWIANCEWIESTYPGIHRLFGVQITFTDGPYGAKAGSIP